MDYIDLLKREISEKASLADIVDAFEKMCSEPIADDMILFETGTFSFTGEPLFYFAWCDSSRKKTMMSFIRSMSRFCFSLTAKIVNSPEQSGMKTLKKIFFTSFGNQMYLHMQNLNHIGTSKSIWMKLKTRSGSHTPGINPLEIPLSN